MSQGQKRIVRLRARTAIALTPVLALAFAAGWAVAGSSPSTTTDTVGLAGAISAPKYSSVSRTWTPRPKRTTTTQTSSSTTSPTSTRSTTATSSSTSSSTTSATATSSTTAPSGGSTAWPGADNTGVPAGVALTSSGSMKITTPGQVVDAKNITGTVVIAASNVVIKRSRISAGSSASFAVMVESGSVSIVDSEIIGGKNGIGFNNWRATRVEIRGQFQDGTKLGNNVTLEDSWIHSLTPESGAHADGGQMQNGVVNLVVRHNNISSANTATGSVGNAALFLAPDLGPSTVGPVTVSNNLLNGGNYTVYCVDGNNGQYLVKNMSFTNNAFGKTSRYGASSVNVPITQSGNYWAGTSTGLTL